MNIQRTLVALFKGTLHLLLDRRDISETVVMSRETSSKRISERRFGQCRKLRRN